MAPKTSLDRAEIGYEPEANPAEGSDVISSNSVKVVDVNPEDTRLGNLQPTVSLEKDEPIVTRRELWSYYRQFFLLS